MKKIFFIFFSLGSIASLFAILALAHLSDGFSVNKITSSFPLSPKWEVASPKKEVVEKLLSQNFYYLRKGSQYYVFESEDRDIVLKFFRLSRYRLPGIAHLITSPAFLIEIRDRTEAVKQHKLDLLFQSCKIAYEELQEETGLLYLHLNRTSNLKKTILLFDRLKRVHPINIDEYAFMIQTRGEHIFPYLTRLLEHGKKKEAEKALDDLTTLLIRRMQKGIVDNDAVIHKNTGFRENRALFLDVGAFSKKRIFDRRSYLYEITRTLRFWLEEQDPELARHFAETLNFNLFS